jgi:hypothetical protein
MFPPARLLPFSILLACVGQADDSGSSNDTQVEDDGVHFQMNFVDGFTQENLVGAEVCVIEPEDVDDICMTTDENGSFEWTWTEPKVTNFLNRLTLESYVDTLHLGHYNDELGVAWETLYEETGVVALTYFAYSETVSNIMLDGGGAPHEDGMGHVLFALVSQDGSSMEGAVASLIDDTGESVGTVLYVDEGAAGLDAELHAHRELFDLQLHRGLLLALECGR